MSNVQSSIEFIPLNKLSASQLNVRKKDRKADIEMLAASILAHGLLQNLNVVSKDQGRFDVVAGGRRLAALKLLASRGAVARDFAVPCCVTKPEDAGEASLAENIQRAAMDPMDEVEAFAALTEKGQDAEEIARRFGCGRRQVEQRLALARLSPKLKAAYRRGDLSMDAARAFCITDDHTQQEAVFKALGRHVMHAANVRSHLMCGAMRANDRIARFVGLDAYEAAGGRVTRDLFLEQEAYIDDPALMTRLADERLEPTRQEALNAGWGWAQINLSSNGVVNSSGERLYPMRRTMSGEESAAVEAIEAEEEDLNEALEDAEEDDPGWTRLDELAAKRHALFEACQDWDPDLKPLAGAQISLDHDGRPVVALGHVSKDDAAKFRRLKAAKQQVEEAAKAEVDEGLVPPWEAPISTLPKTLTRELTQKRTEVLRSRLVTEPDRALALAVYALSSRTRGGYGAAGIALDCRPQPAYENIHAFEHEGETPAQVDACDAVLEWCLLQAPPTLLKLLASLVASALDFSHDGATREDGRKQGIADQLAAALDLDMRQHWSADADFLSRLSKAILIDILVDVTGADLSETEIAAMRRAQAKASKTDLIQTVAAALSGTGWLPDVLVTPAARGAFVLTPDAHTTIAAE